MTETPENARRDHAGRFLPGTSGNPAGKPKGARHKTTLAAEALLDSEAEALTRRAIEAALEGDTAALRLCLDRVLPARKGRPVAFEIGALDTAKDLAAAARRVLEAVAAGNLSPDEAQAVGAAIDMARKALETEDLERRIAELEART